MTMALLPSLALFCFVSSITPGPNNLMLMSSGLTFGFARTIPHMLGVALGFTFMVALVGLGIDALFLAVPQLYVALKIISVIYLLWLAVKIATAGPIADSGAVSGQPLSFLSAAAFQWVNPKAWIMAVTATAVYAPKESFVFNVLMVALVFGIINLPCISLWVTFGTILRRWLHRPILVHAVNIGMALALVASLKPIVLELWAGL